MTEPTRANMLVSISAKPKSGKSYFSMTFPEPIKIYSFDLGAEFVRKSKFPDKAITIKDFVLPIIDSEHPEPWAQPIWESFYQEYRRDVESGTYQTLVIDTATAVETILRQSVFEELADEAAGKGRLKTKLATNEYTARNLRMSALFGRAKNNGVNLVTIQYLKQEWVKAPGKERAEPTGELVLDGWNQTDGLVDVVLEMEGKFKAGKRVHMTTIKANRFDDSFDGKVFEDTNYEELYALLIGE